MWQALGNCKDQDVKVKVTIGAAYSGKLAYIGETYIILSNSVIGTNKHGTEIRGENIINMMHIVSICEDAWNKD